MAEDHCAHEEGPTSRHLQSRLGLYLRGRRLQPGTDAKSGSIRSSICITQGRSVSVLPENRLSGTQMAQPEDLTPTETESGTTAPFLSPVFQHPAREPAIGTR